MCPAGVCVRSVCGCERNRDYHPCLYMTTVEHREREKREREKDRERVSEGENALSYNIICLLFRKFYILDVDNENCI